jgi:cell division inhibitor SulA
MDYTTAEVRKIKRSTDDLPKRNRRYLLIRRQQFHLSEWARRCGIELHTLIMIEKRRGHSVMIQTIKAGLDGKYDAKLNRRMQRLMHLETSATTTLPRAVYYRT